MRRSFRLLVHPLLLLAGPLLVGEPLEAQRRVLGTPSLPTLEAAAEDSLFQGAARRAWQYVVRETQAETGLANSIRGYPYATIWDIGSNLLAIHSAGELGFISPEETEARLAKALVTLARLPLFDRAAFNKVYQIARGQPTGRDGYNLSTSGGFGWSATDLGRLLIALWIVREHHPALGNEVERVVSRIDMNRLVREGRMWGGMRNSRGQVYEYPEGELSYEQYAAAGFALWKNNVDAALDITIFGRPVQVMGVEVLAESRRKGWITSDPFVLMGLELGWWRPEWQTQAERVLAAQRARFEETGQLTIIGEDAIPIAPHHFFYYSLYTGDEPFVVVTKNLTRPEPAPRWISTKNALGWYALFPNEYTGWAASTIATHARDEGDWASGIYEGSLRPTAGSNLNTVAVILEAALYRTRGRRPLIATASPEAPAPEALSREAP